jgi:hypothetical protein
MLKYLLSLQGMTDQNVFTNTNTPFEANFKGGHHCQLQGQGHEVKN